MADFTADFEAGINGNTITTGAGEASATAWNLVLGTPAPTYSDTHAAHGSLAAKIVADDAEMQWDCSITDSYGRFYFYATANPGSELNLAKFYKDGGGIAGAFIAITNTGNVKLKDTGAAHSQLSTAAISLNQWIRIEWHLIASPTVGQFEAKLFNTADSQIATETITPAANWDTGTTTTKYGFADRDGSWGSDTWFDDIIANATAYPGPAVTPSVTNLAPVIYGRGAC